MRGSSLFFFLFNRFFFTKWMEFLYQPPTVKDANDMMSLIIYYYWTMLAKIYWKSICKHHSFIRICHENNEKKWKKKNPKSMLSMLWRSQQASALHFENWSTTRIKKHSIFLIFAELHTCYHTEDISVQTNIKLFFRVWCFTVYSSALGSFLLSRSLSHTSALRTLIVLVCKTGPCLCVSVTGRGKERLCRLSFV